ncbi:hypothetical protein SBA1_1340005 [Candidatus Sulfotelmatobacter kueseliae]|uniref:Uncharacterized protein n=1 Tax=Candidatus Sulfotelmatobacter kueseliae TaxID=2042962 RepID=A0A2U3K556_9BACT|nr:hypothetical protein SBA1_1340005 [Candidatus Sulfotelmatobacter kueseliae]
MLDVKGDRYDTEPLRISRTPTAAAAFLELRVESKMERVRVFGHAVGPNWNSLAYQGFLKAT